jgi:hypothetical protein
LAGLSLAHKKFAPNDFAPKNSDPKNVKCAPNNRSRQKTATSRDAGSGGVDWMKSGRALTSAPRHIN